MRSWFFKKIRLWNKNVIVTPRVSNYVNSFVVKNELPLMNSFQLQSKKLYRASMQTTIAQARFLSLMIKAIKANNVLEIGTFRGYGTAHMAQSLPDSGEIITCEFSQEYANQAQKLFIDLKLDKKIKIIIGKASDTLSNLIKEKKQFDLIFIDADKPGYKGYFEQSLQLIKSGGTILIDNTLWASLVTFKNPNDPIADITKSFNNFIFEKIGENAVIIPVWDGLTMVIAP